MEIQTGQQTASRTRSEREEATETTEIQASKLESRTVYEEGDRIDETSVQGPTLSQPVDKPASAEKARHLDQPQQTDKRRGILARFQLRSDDEIPIVSISQQCVSDAHPIGDMLENAVGWGGRPTCSSSATTNNKNYGPATHHSIVAMESTQNQPLM